jgi:Ca-activated chloride channel homolog
MLLYLYSMTWYRDPGLLEYSLIFLFILFYVAFIYRNRLIARRLNSNRYSVLFKFTLRLIYFSLMIVALLGPSFGETRKEIKAVGKDIYIAVDLSNSMNAIDVQPSRLEKVKFELKKIVSALEADRIGIIVFSSEAFLQCPLTFDQKALFLFIETLNTSLVPSGGTDFSGPLQMALSKHNAPENPTLRNQAKAIILISDGEDFGEETDRIAREIEKEGIRLFTLGVGTQAGSRIPARNGFKKDQSGNDVVTTLNSRSLVELASRTGGRYYEISDQQNDTGSLIEAIQAIEGELRDTRSINVSANKYFYFLLVALLLIIADVVLTVRIIKLQ